ncbi:MAG: DNA translocase FtsK [Candidatus Gracilibacteria bacterium]|nr:DNA translocase FtsK [Candidatus Gracilibacteria bacterium]
MGKKNKKQRPQFNQELKNIFGGLFIVFFAILGFFSDEKSFIGRYMSDFLNLLYGEQFRIIFSPVLFLLGILISLKKLYWNNTRIIGLMLFWFSVESIIGFYSKTITGIFDFHSILEDIIGRIPGEFLAVGGFLLSLYLIFKISYIQVLKTIHSSLPSASSVKEGMVNIKNDLKKDMKENNKENKKGKSKGEYNDEVDNLTLKIKELEKLTKQSERIEKPKKEIEEPIRKIQVEKKGILDMFKKDEKKDEKAVQTKLNFATWDFPSADLLNVIKSKGDIDERIVEQKSLEIKKTLLQFKIDVDMKGYTVGPTVIQYRLKPSEGVKLNKIENLKKDLVLALKAKSIRIQAPIPGLGLVGVEVPNENRQVIGIREIIESKEFINAKSNLSLVIGKDINGDYVVGDLSKMPHLLIAGQTGSGKSVGMNGFILSLLYKNSPDMLRMIMIDPKRVELGIYNGIPHLLTPVINEADKALNSLKWGVAEMMRRYDILTQTRSRNIDEYNKKVVKKERLPNIVIIVDELADLMMSGNKKEVENAIVRIAQMARAVGMHLIIATQRPSVDVITGLIKANVPSRIAFTVASLVDSRTILDKMGAEDLLGKGDMLYSPSGSVEPERMQGVLVETEEVESVVHHIKRTIDPAMLEDIYDKSIVEGESSNFDGSIMTGDHDEDPKILDEAIKICREAGKASTSLLQRRLKLGYARAARVIDILEDMGIVGPPDGSKPRDVY